MPTAQETRRWSLDLTRVVAVVGVAAIHIFAAMVANVEIHGSRRWWAPVVVDIGFVWVVAVFVMISGVFILAPRQFKDGLGTFYKRRILRLAPATAFWSLFYFIVIRTGLSNVEPTPVDFAAFFLDGRPYTHLYFLWLILGLYAVAPVLAAFLHAGGRRRSFVMASVLLAATVVTASSSSFMASLESPRPLTLMALTQWIPYVGYFVAGWALRNVALRGWALLAAVTGTALAIVIGIVQYGVRPAAGLLDAVAPISYFGPIVAAASIGVFLCANSMLADWSPRPLTQRVLRELSDCAFGVFLVHFAVMVLLRQLPFFAYASSSLLLTGIQWAGVVVLSFVIVAAMRRVPFVRRLI